jgi:hypothetical protein
MKFIYHDGGRAAAGLRKSGGDCVTRAIAIVTQLPYPDVYHRLAMETGNQRASSRTPKQRATADLGIYTKRKWFHDYMTELGFTWIPTMNVGTGCRVHLRKGELPMGKLVVSVSKHMTAVINGVIFDTHDPSRKGTRCVYGYYELQEK